jgi:hypothetical protein
MLPLNTRSCCCTLACDADPRSGTECASDEPISLISPSSPISTISSSSPISPMASMSSRCWTRAESLTRDATRDLRTCARWRAPPQSGPRASGCQWPLAWTHRTSGSSPPGHAGSQPRTQGDGGGVAARSHRAAGLQGCRAAARAAAVTSSSSPPMRRRSVSRSTGGRALWYVPASSCRKTSRLCVQSAHCSSRSCTCRTEVVPVHAHAGCNRTCACT